MGHLGSFGAAVREFDPDAERDTFEFCGETFTVMETIPEFLALRFSATQAGKVNQSEASAAVLEVLRYVLTRPEHQKVDKSGDTVTVPADDTQYERFHQLAIDRKAEIEKDLTPLLQALLEGQTGHPTERLSASSDGQSTTSPSSSTSSSTPPAWPGMVSVQDLVAGSRS